MLLSRLYEMHACIPGRFSRVQLFAALHTVANQDPLSMESSRQENLSFHALLQGIFPTQESNPGLPLCRRILYQPRYQGCPL